jgi:dipeptidyl aminopeptidase/acylaminoacyl peptidase
MIAAGSRLGPYEVLGPLGAGGMGEVYRARDTRLGRDVAVKVLPESVARDPRALARFEREAKTVAALTHPNILAIHDFGSDGGVAYAVTELLEGQTLAALLAAGPLPARRSSAIAREMAEGLAAAHAKGIVHRDLKPENVFVTKDGHVKILDFGLAGDVVTLSASGTSAPTERPLTEPGTVMGTVGYMSPEQVRGAAVDSRSDVFSFGAVLYEMLSGRRAFQKPTAAETMTAVLNDEPPELPPLSGVASSLELVARRCLEKPPGERFQDTRDVVFALEMASGGLGSGPQAASPATGNRRWRRLAPIALLLVAAVGAGVGLLSRRSRAPEPPRFSRATFRRGYVRGARFGADGRSIVYAAAWDGGPLKLYLKQPENPDPIPLALPSADILALSPSGELAIALDCRPSNNGICKGRLARVPMTGSSPREIAEDVQQADFGGNGELAIVREVTQQQKSRLEYPPGKLLYEATNGYVSFPRVSPDGKRIAFFDHPVWRDDQGFVAVVDLGGKKKILTKSFASLRGLAWSPAGDEVWFTAVDTGQRALYAVKLSEALRTVYRAPGHVMLCDISRDGRVLLSREEERTVVLGAGPGDKLEKDLSWLDFTHINDISNDGKLVVLYEDTGEAAGSSGVLLLRNIDGSPPVRLGEGYGQLSPDGKHVLAAVSGAAALKILPVGAGEQKTVKMDGLERLAAIWFPDSRRILVHGHKPGQPPALFLVDPDKGIEREIVLKDAPATGFVVTPDSRRIFADRSDGTWAFYPIDGGEPVPFRSILREEEPVRFSGDGRALFVERPRSLPLSVFRIDLASGARTHWRDFEPEDRAGLSYVRDVVLSADGSAYAYQYRRWLCELYTVEGLK